MKASQKVVAERHDRYLTVVRRLQARYQRGMFLVVSVGGKPSRYSRLEMLAFWRYAMGESRAMAAARIAAVYARAQQIAEAA